MSCDVDFEILMAYLDGDLAPIERGRIAEHIVGCATCRDAVSDLRAVSGALTKWVVPEPVALPTARELLDRAGSPSQVVGTERPSWRDGALRWAAAAMLLVVAGAVAIGVMERRPFDNREQSSSSNSSETPAPAPPSNTNAAETTRQVPAENASPGAPAAKQPEAAKALGQAGEEPAGVAGPPPGSVSDEKRNDAETETGVAEQPAVAPATPSVDQPKPAEPPPPPRQEAPADAVESGGASVASKEANEDKADRRAITGRVATAPGFHSRKTAESLAINSDVLTIETHDIDSAAGGVQSTARSLGGSVSSAASISGKNGSRTTTIVIVVPTEQFEQAISRIKGLGVLKGEMRSSRDVGPALAKLDDEADDRAAGSKSKDSEERQRAELESQARRATIRVTLREPK